MLSRNVCFYMFIVLLKLSSDDDLLAYVSNSEFVQKFINMQDAILRSLYDDDLSVVQAALSIEGLAVVANPDSLLKAYDGVLTKCIKIINKGGYSSMSACFLAQLNEFFFLSLGRRSTELFIWPSTFFYPFT